MGNVKCKIVESALADFGFLLTSGGVDGILCSDNRIENIGD